jgi:asparagine synthase (glutamine-hydrolysing)
MFNSDCAPIDLNLVNLRNDWITAKDVQFLGKGQYAAFVAPQPGSVLPREDVTYRVALDGRFWLIGRVRLDAREELGSTISGTQVMSQDQSDALICLRAYARWGDRCLEHLRGDFCFAVWDEHRRRLFCGRDQLGVRPLFYAKQGSSWLVSDTLQFIVAEATIDGDLDDYWVADFLSSGFCADLDRTVYKQVKRLPPAHFLSVCARSYVVQKYWTLEIHDPIYYRRTTDYVEHFQSVIALAIRDRLPQDRVGISMSGGLDSSTLAAQALRVTGDASKIIAHTRYFEHLIADEESHFSSLVARRLGVPLTLRAVDDAAYDPHWYDRELRTPEPNSAIVRAAPERIIVTEMAKEAQVWFFGEGPDNALVFEWQPYLRWLFKRADWFRLGNAVVQYIRSKQASEWCSTISKYTTRRFASEGNLQLELPPWLNEGLVKELHLIARAHQSGESVKKHLWHPRAVASFTGALWPYFLEQFDPSVWGSPLVWRHPYLDLRVLAFLLSVPPIPWARRKGLIREAMRGVLPPEVLSRNKSPLCGNPQAIMLQKCGLPQLSLEGSILHYIDNTKVPTTPTHESVMYVYVLASWLKSNRTRFLSNRSSLRFGG